ncbi:MAG: hypothetical protein ACJ74O_11265 [Frankiaceae bacterium]
MSARTPTDPTDEPLDGDDDAAEVIDHAAVIRDDELLTAISSVTVVDALTWDDQPLTPSEPDADGEDAPDDPPDRTIALLLALRADLERAGRSAHHGTGVLPEADEADEADETNEAAGRPVAHEHRTIRFVPRTIAAATGAAIVLSVGGVAAAAVGAGPHSWLYPLHRALVNDRGPTASQQAAAQVRRDLQEAGTALGRHDLARAGAALGAARRIVWQVAPSDGATSLRAQLDALQARLDAALAAPPPGTAPGATEPSERPAPAPSASPFGRDDVPGKAVPGRGGQGHDEGASGSHPPGSKGHGTPAHRHGTGQSGKHRHGGQGTTSGKGGGTSGQVSGGDGGQVSGGDGGQVSSRESGHHRGGKDGRPSDRTGMRTGGSSRAKIGKAP